MIKKGHVGRPTNEEAANKKKKKIIKISLITVLILFIIGGITLFINRDNIDFSSLMGASSLKRKKFVINEYNDCPAGCFEIYLDTKKLNGYGYTSCKVNKDFANCQVKGDRLRVNSKRKGNINVKVYGENIKGKKVSKTVRIKVKDPNPPLCNFALVPSNPVKKGGIAEVIIKCNENVKFDKAGYGMYGLSGSIVNSKSCSGLDRYIDFDFNFYDRLDDNSYKFYLPIPKDVCSGYIRITGKKGMFKDSNGNFNIYTFQSKTFSIK